MRCFTGSELKEKINSIENLKTYKKRFCFSVLEEYFSSKNDHRVMSLYGLRRSGKTVMMYQMIQELQDYDSVGFIQCLPEERMYDLTKIMDDHPECKTFFVDEVTNLENFIKTASVLSDAYTSFGKKIVLSGTDSLGFSLAQRDQLFDRTHILHTTYISYKEWNYLLGKSLDEYIQYGGLLTDGKINYNNEFYSYYTDSAIIYNLTKTLSYAGRDGEYGELISIYKNHDMRTFINKILELYNRTFLAETVNREFISHDLGSLKDLLEKRHIGINPRLLDNESLRKTIMADLDIQEPLHSIATPRAIKEAKEWLEILDVIYRIPSTIDEENPEREEVIFTQPALRYNQLQQLVENLKNSPALSVLSPVERTFLGELISEDIKGRMLEDIVYYQLAKDDEIKQKYNVSKYKSPYGEFDIILLNKDVDQAIAIEVKHSTKAVENQTVFLNSDTVCQKFEEDFHVQIKGKVVIYMGETTSDKIFNVNYFKADDFLQDPLKMLDQFQLNPLQYVPILRCTEMDKEIMNCFSVNYFKNINKMYSTEKAAINAVAKLFIKGYASDVILSATEKILPQAKKNPTFLSNLVQAALKKDAVKKALNRKKK